MTRFGLMCPPDGDPADIAAIARGAEERGFDFLACGEHLFFHSPTSNAFVTLAAAAGATERIRLLSAVTLLPQYPAVLAAKQATTLDRVSRGRFELGVGIGGEYPPEFAAAGVPVRQRVARTEEALALLRALFAGGPVTLDGRFAQVDGLALDPPPWQPGGPPLWMGGRSEAAMDRAARHADVLVPHFVSPRRLAGTVERVRELAQAHGRAADAVRGAVFCWGCVDRDGDWARRSAVEVVSGIYNQDFTDIAEALLPAGDPAAVTDRFGAYAAAGAETVIFTPACPREDQERVLDTFAAEVMPVLRKETE